MAQIDARHWQVESGQNWTTLAAAIGCTRGQLLIANGQPNSNPPALQTGQVVHTPFPVVP